MDKKTSEMNKSFEESLASKDKEWQEKMVQMVNICMCFTQIIGYKILLHSFI